LDVQLSKLTAGQYASLWHSERAAASGAVGGSTMTGVGTTAGSSFRPCALSSYYSRNR
jgi:hypothetical protein